MKKKAAIIFTVIMLALTAGLTGCGRNDVDTPDAGDNNVTEEERKTGDAGSLNEGVVENGDMIGDATDAGDAVPDEARNAGDAVRDDIRDTGDAIRDGAEDLTGGSRNSNQ